MGAVSGAQGTAAATSDFEPGLRARTRTLCAAREEIVSGLAARPEFVSPVQVNSECELSCVVVFIFLCLFVSFGHSTTSVVMPAETAVAVTSLAASAEKEWDGRRHSEKERVGES